MTVYDKLPAVVASVLITLLCLFISSFFLNIMFDISKQLGCANFAKHTGQKWEWVDYDGCYLQDHDNKFIKHRL